jgi:hypothetical protein
VDFIHKDAAQLAAMTEAQWGSLVNSYSTIAVAATLLTNGTVLAVGGVSNHDQSSAEYYRP